MDHHLFVLLQRPQQQQQQHPLSSKDNASTSSDILAAASHATATAVLISGSTSTHMKVDVVAIFGCSLSGPTSRSCTSSSVRGTNQGKNFMRLASPSRQKECLLYTHNDTKALIRHLQKASHYMIHPRRFARNASYERRCFWRITTQAHPASRTCSSSTPHLMGHGPGRSVKTRSTSMYLISLSGSFLNRPV